MSTQNQLDFYQQVEEFIICSVANDTTGDHALNNEIGMFLLMLLCEHKKRHDD